MHLQVGIQHISVPLIYVTKSDLLLMDTLILKWHEKIVTILILQYVYFYFHKQASILYLYFI